MLSAICQDTSRDCTGLVQAQDAAAAAHRAAQAQRRAALEAAQAQHLEALQAQEVAAAAVWGEKRNSNRVS